MSTTSIQYLKPQFTAREVAEWLNENISPGSTRAYTASATARTSSYKSDDSMSWRIDNFGGYGPRHPPKITVTLPPEHSERLTEKFPHGASINAPSPAESAKYQETALPGVNAPATEQLSGSLTTVERDLFQRLQVSGNSPTSPAPAHAEQANDSGPLVLLEREKTGFCDTFTEHLCLERLGVDEWRLGVYQYNCISAEDVPQEVLFPDFVPDEEQDEPDWADIELPIAWEGHNITEMNDGVFLTDELVSMDKGVKFGKESLRDALKYCQSKKWHKEDEFEEAWLELMRTVAVRFVRHGQAVERTQSTSSEVGAVGPKSSISGRAPTDSIQILRTILSESPGHGSFSERHTLPSGEGVIHRFSLATGLAAAHFSRKYSAQFGQPPSWLAVCHPTHRRQLCAWALENQVPLPDESPQH